MQPGDGTVGQRPDLIDGLLCRPGIHDDLTQRVHLGLSGHRAHPGPQRRRGIRVGGIGQSQCVEQQVCSLAGAQIIAGGFTGDLRLAEDPEVVVL